MKQRKERIHEIIAKSIEEKMKESYVFGTWDLAEEIYSAFEAEGLVEVALTSLINTIICDICEVENI